MPDSKRNEPTQRTRPKKGKPVEIPVPKRSDVLRDLGKVFKGRKAPKD